MKSVLPIINPGSLKKATNNNKITLTILLATLSSKLGVA
jgi:hypothetical protein